MANIKGNARQLASVQRVAEGADVYLRMLRSGEIGVVDFIALLSLEGLVLTVNVGKATTPIAFNGGGLVTTEFDLHVAVPASVVIIPLELSVSYEVYGTTLLLETLMQSGSGSVVGAGTAVTPLSSNVSSGKTSACTCTYVAAAGTAFTTNIKEIWRDTQQKVVTLATVTDLRDGESYNKTWKASTSGVLDVVGPSQQLAVWASANAGQGYITLKYAELPVSAVS